MNENYGLVPENPLKMSGVRASMVLLENLITKDGFHILFHRPTSIDSPNTKNENGKDKILDEYELITGNGKILNLYIDIYNDENLWIPPNLFMFKFDLLYLEDVGVGVEIEVKIEPAYVFDCEQIGLDIFDFYERNKKFEIERILDGSWGVNYKVNNFPEGLIEIYKNRNSR